MEALIVISGLLAAAPVGAVGLGYANATPNAPIPQTNPNTLPGNIIAAVQTGAIAPTATTTPSGAPTPVATGLTYAQAVAYRQKGYVIIGGSAYAPGTDPAAAYAPRPAGSRGSPTEAELEDYEADGFTANEATAIILAGGQADAAADLQAKVYRGGTARSTPRPTKSCACPGRQRAHPRPSAHRADPRDQLRIGRAAVIGLVLVVVLLVGGYVLYQAYKSQTTSGAVTGGLL